MKKYLVVVAAIAMVIAMVGGAWAAGSVAPTVTASGTVARICTSAVNGAITFNIDPSGSGALTPTAAGNGTEPTVKCTKNETVNVTCAGAHASLTPTGDGTGDAIPYSITTCASGASSGTISGAGFSSAKSIPVGITVAQADYQDAAAGVHQDVITVTVAY